MEDGFYAVKNGELFKIDPRIKMPIAKSVNVKTGEIHYPSNADRIRSMTDEELAVFLEGAVCPTPFNGSWCKQPSGSGKRYNCKDCWLDWLKEEAEGDSNEGRNN